MPLVQHMTMLVPQECCNIACNPWRCVQRLVESDKSGSCGFFPSPVLQTSERRKLITSVASMFLFIERQERYAVAMIGVAFSDNVHV